MQDEQVDHNLKGMDDLDFDGWNKADWNGIFAHHHTDDVLVDWKGQEPTHGVEQHIDDPSMVFVKPRWFEVSGTIAGR